MGYFLHQTLEITLSKYHLLYNISRQKAEFLGLSPCHTIDLFCHLKKIFTYYSETSGMFCIWNQELPPFWKLTSKHMAVGTSLVVQCLRLYTLNPWSGNRIPQATTKSSHAAAEDFVCHNWDQVHSNKYMKNK